MKRSLSYVLLAITCITLLAGIIAVLMYARSKAPGTGGGRAGGPVPVIVTEVRQQEFVDALEAIGTVRSNEAVAITARVSDIVAEILFDDGQIVEKGTVLLRLSDARARAELAEARANLEDQTKQLQRIEALVASKALPQSQLDERRALHAIAGARVMNREAALAEHVIEAPFSGILGLRMVSPGSLVTPGTEITTLDDISVVKLDFSVPETFLSVIRPGQSVLASSVAFPDRQFEGEVVTIGSRINPVTRAVAVRAALPNPEHRLRPGMLLTIDLEKDRRQTILVPEEAIVPIGDRTYIFIVANGTAERLEVRTGQRIPGMVEIVDGLAVGQKIIIDGSIRLRDGLDIRIVEERQTPQTAGHGRGRISAS